MKKLSLLRHADADWGAKGSKDFDRSLSIIGQNQCLTVAKTIEQSTNTPDLVLCSPARRAVETCQKVEAALSNIPWSVTENTTLYLCNSSQMLDIIQDTQDSCDHLLIIGHNPTLQEVSWLLTGKSDGELMRTIECGFPPATMTRHTFDCDHWMDIDKGRGTLQSVIKV